MTTESSSSAADRPLAEERADDSASPQAKKEQAWREWMMVGVGWTALLSLIALIISLAALGSSNPHTTLMMGQGQGSGSSVQTEAVRTQDVRLVIRSDTEHGRMGPDGKWHDAYLPANFTVHAGDRVKVTVVNYDTSAHSFTSSSLSSSQLINQMISAGSAGSPSTTTFTFIAPTTPGQYAWWCAMPCDPYAMAHVGFMRGNVTVAA